MIVRAQGVSYAYVPGQLVLRKVSLDLSTGRLAFLLGPNGSGKTTFLDCLGGLRRPTEGEVRVGDRSIREIPMRQRAQLVAYVPQFHEPPFSFSVEEIVLMGRAPYIRWLSQPGRADRAAADEALEAMGIRGLRSRSYYTLSGGERRLALVARGLAQGATFLLLDEPDAHLDPANQHRVLRATGNLVHEGLGVAVTSHSPNNALLYAGWVALFCRGEVLAEGTPAEVITPALLEAAYGIPFLVVGDGPQAVVPKIL